MNLRYILPNIFEKVDSCIFFIGWWGRHIILKSIQINKTDKQDWGKPREFFHSIRYCANGSGRILQNAYWQYTKCASDKTLNAALFSVLNNVEGNSAKRNVFGFSKSSKAIAVEYLIFQKLLDYVDSIVVFLILIWNHIPPSDYVIYGRFLIFIKNIEYI